LVAGDPHRREDLESEGKADRRLGEAEGKIDHAKDMVDDAIDKTRDVVDDANSQGQGRAASEVGL
jgi:uncharacterized protein YjbJ (UPF0337 family)